MANISIHVFIYDTPHASYCPVACHGPQQPPSPPLKGKKALVFIIRSAHTDR